jgi:two-component system cell cycle sensor histidine kinase/response regulator CckA
MDKTRKAKRTSKTAGAGRKRRGQEERFRSLFMECPVALWEEDIAELLAHLDGLRTSGIRDLHSYFTSHPGEVVRCTGLINIIGVNKATLSLYEAPNEQSLLASLSVIFTEESFIAFRDIVIALFEGKTQFEIEGTNRTLQGRELKVGLKWSLLPDSGGKLTRVLLSVVDLTERKRIEEERRNNDVRLSRAQAIAHVGDWEWDIATNAVYWSDELYRIYGFEPRSLSPDYGLVLSQMHPSSKDEFLQAIDAALKEDRHFAMDYRFFRKDGTEAALHTIGQVIRDAAGAPARMVGIVQDLTEQRRAEVRLHESEEKFRTIFENATDGIMIADAGTKMNIEANKAMCAMMGYTRDELLRLRVADVHPKEALPEVLNAFERQLRGEISLAENIPMLRKDGTVFSADINSVTVTLSGRPRLIGIFRDITDRKRAEEENDRLARAVSIVSEGIAVTDEQDRFIYLNDAHAKTYGYLQSELMGKTWRDVTPRTLVPLIEHEMAQTLRRRENGVWSGETPGLCKDGTGIATEITATARWNEKGEYAGHICVVRDITERRQADAALKAREKQLAESQRIAHIGSWEHNLSTGEVFWSDELFRLLGLDPRKDPADFEMFIAMIHPDDRPALKKAIDETVQFDEPFNIDYRFTLRDGTTRIMHVQAELRRDEPGSQLILSGTGQDITERKRAEEALQKTSQMLGAIVRYSPLAVICADADGNVLTWNPAAERIFGWSEQEVLGKLNPIVPKERVEEYRSLLEGVRRGHPYISKELRRQRKDGSLITLNASSAPLYDAAGSVIGLLGMFEDITERKHSDEEKDRLTKAISIVTEGIALTDEEDRYIYLNDAHAKTYGFTPRELMGKTWRAVTPPRLVPLLENHLARTLHSRDCGVWSGEAPGLHRDGTEISTEITATARWNEQGEYLGHICVVKDITERKRSEEKIRESEAFIRSILDTVDEGFIVIDRDYRIVTANRAYCSQVSLSCDTIIGKHCYEISHRTNRPCYEEGEECAVRKVFETGESHTVIHKHADREGHILFVETKAFPIKDVSGTVVSAIETISNITERHLLEEERLKTQKLESIGTLAGGIAHDFNNLLQGVFGYISMAKMMLDQREKSLAMLEQAEKAVHQSVNLTSQLLTFSKGGKPVKKVLDLRQVIEDASRFALSGSRSGCTLDIQPGLWQVDADGGQVGQVIQNIVLNADQAMPLGGRVTITARNLPVSEEASHTGLERRDQIMISIEDQGVGIPENCLDKIFDPYFTTKEKGNGLGLATSYSIIKNHGGRIEVTSKVGIGTVFHIYLPAVQVEASLPVERPQLSADRPVRVLVMDDEELIRKVARELLEILGHSVEFAEHGDAAIEKYKQAKDEGRPFDAVILDLTIRGGRGGAETVQAMLSIDPGVKAVVSSGYSDDEIIATYRQHGFRAFLKKPYSLEDLNRALADAGA